MILLAVPTRWETDAILRRLPMDTLGAGTYLTTSPRIPVALVRTGEGDAAVRAALQALESRPAVFESGPIALVVSCGFAAAVQSELRPGDVVADVRGLDSTIVEASRQAASSAGVRLAFGPVGHADPPLDSTARLRLGADPAARVAVLDAETASVKLWSAARGVPCLAVRAVLEAAAESVDKRSGGRLAVAWQDWSARRRRRSIASTLARFIFTLLTSI